MSKPAFPIAAKRGSVTVKIYKIPTRSLSTGGKANLNQATDGGLYAELFQNRSFDYTRRTTRAGICCRFGRSWNARLAPPVSR